MDVLFILYMKFDIWFLLVTQHYQTLGFSKVFIQHNIDTFMALGFSGPVEGDGAVAGVSRQLSSQPKSGGRTADKLLSRAHTMLRAATLSRGGTNISQVTHGLPH